MGILDTPAYSRPQADARFALALGVTEVGWLGDSLTANGSTPTSVYGTIAASAAGATSITFTSLADSHPSPTLIAAGNAIVIEPGAANEEYVRISAVSGSSNPYTLTVAALANAHPAGSEVRTVARWYTAKSVPFWVSLLSGNRVRLGGIFAHGGYLLADIRDIYLPQVIARSPKLRYVFVNGGRNDGYSLASRATYAQILDRLIAAGITPVVHSAPPDSGPGFETAINTWNIALAKMCRDRGIPFIDVYSALVDDGTGGGGAPEGANGKWKRTYSPDWIHPNEIGARVWAQTIVDSVTKWMVGQTDTQSAKYNDLSNDTTTYPLLANNAVMLIDTNADGIPDGWTKSQGNAGDTTVLVTRTGVPGKMFSATRVAAGTTDPLFLSSSFTIVPGHKYRVFLRIETSGLDAAYVNQISTTGGPPSVTASAFLGFDLRLGDNGGLDDVLFTMKTWNRDIGLTVISHDFIAPKGLSNNSTRWALRLRGSAASPAYTVAIQPFLVDLTAAGAA